MSDRKPPDADFDFSGVEQEKLAEERRAKARRDARRSSPLDDLKLEVDGLENQEKDHRAVGTMAPTPYDRQKSQTSKYLGPTALMAIASVLILAASGFFVVSKMDDLMAMAMNEAMNQMETADNMEWETLEEMDGSEPLGEGNPGAAGKDRGAPEFETPLMKQLREKPDVEDPDRVVGSGTVEILTQPGGCDVTLNAHHFDRYTPIKINRVPAGPPVTILVECLGHESELKTFRISPGETKIIRLKLEPL